MHCLTDFQPETQHISDDNFEATSRRLTSILKNQFHWSILWRRLGFATDLVAVWFVCKTSRGLSKPPISRSTRSITVGTHGPA